MSKDAAGTIIDAFKSAIRGVGEGGEDEDEDEDEEEEEEESDDEDEEEEEEQGEEGEEDGVDSSALHAAMWSKRINMGIDRMMGSLYTAAKTFLPAVEELREQMVGIFQAIEPSAKRACKSAVLKAVWQAVETSQGEQPDFEEQDKITRAITKALVATVTQELVEPMFQKPEPHLKDVHDLVVWFQDDILPEKARSIGPRAASLVSLLPMTGPTASSVPPSPPPSPPSDEHAATVGGTARQRWQRTRQRAASIFLSARRGSATAPSLKDDERDERDEEIEEEEENGADAQADAILPKAENSMLMGEKDTKTINSLLGELVKQMRRMLEGDAAITEITEELGDLFGLGGDTPSEKKVKPLKDTILDSSRGNFEQWVT